MKKMPPKPKITPRLILEYIAAPFIILGSMAVFALLVAVPVTIFRILFGL